MKTATVLTISALSILSYFTVFAAAQKEQESSGVPDYAPPQHSSTFIRTYLTEVGAAERREKLHVDEDGLSRRKGALMMEAADGVKNCTSMRMDYHRIFIRGKSTCQS